MSICVHQPLVWYMTNKHAAGYGGLFKGPEMEALERRGSFSCPGVTLCQPRWQHSLAWVRSALSNMWWYTHVHTHPNAHTQGTHTMYVNTCKVSHVFYFAATMWIRNDISGSSSNSDDGPYPLTHVTQGIHVGAKFIRSFILWNV